ncbi:MAG: hypothetical protein BWX92_03132 [Deltaproteobacteria bacterium ADurb.Bin135]|nr:MAG: hypothetical protein BWX92_03132 [Deltaproteobacteria bacterium ADurb.Bin135]
MLALPALTCRIVSRKLIQTCTGRTEYYIVDLYSNRKVIMKSLLINDGS